MAEFKKINAPTRKDLFVRELEGMILSGELRIGEKLPTERELASSMQVSRGVINAGLTELARKGFIVMEPRIGSFVADYRRIGNFETLSAIISYNGGLLRDEEIRSILELRWALSDTVVRKLISHITEEEISLLHTLCDKIETSQTADAASQAAFAFHHELAILSGNFLMPLIYNSFHDAVLPLWRRFCNIYGIRQLYQNTSELMHYIETGDADGAADHTRRIMTAATEGDFRIFN